MLEPTKSKRVIPFSLINFINFTALGTILLSTWLFIIGIRIDKLGTPTNILSNTLLNKLMFYFLIMINIFMAIILPISAYFWYF